MNVGHWPVITWLPSATASANARWLLSEEGIQWVSCIIQWPKAIRTIIAWRLYAATMQTLEPPLEVD